MMYFDSMAKEKNRKKRKFERLAINLYQQDVDDLRQMSEDTGISINGFVRAAVHKHLVWLRHEAEKKTGQTNLRL